MNEIDIRKAVNKLKSRVLLDKDMILCRFKDYSHYNGKKQIALRFYYGIGASEKVKEQVVDEFELNSIINTYSFYTPVEEIQSIKINLKEIKMSDHTHDNLKGLRTHLFSAIKKLEGGTMKNEDAKAMAQVAQVIINSAKLEMEFKLLMTDKPKIDLLE